MDSLSAFARGAANRGREMMVFDWHKAAQLIKERKPQVASAGLQSDWEWTGGDIYKNGKPIPRSQTYAYLASTWATPELDMDGKVIPCFLMESETPKGAWGSSTYWPPSARKILKD